MTSELSIANLPTVSTAATPVEENNPNDLGQDAFLELLITQIQNQNPLDPSDPSEFLGQLASFTTLEQMTAINEGIESLSMIQATGLSLENVNLVGRTVVFEGHRAPVVDGEASFRFQTTDYATRVVVEYNDGGRRLTKDVTNVPAGVHDLELDDLIGSDVEILSIQGYNGDAPLDSSISIHTVAKVDGVTFEGGTPKLMLGGTLRVDPAEVIEILE